MKRAFLEKTIRKSKDKKEKTRGRGRRIAAGICALVLLLGGISGAVYKVQSGKESVKAATQMSAQAQIGNVSTSISSSGTLAGKEEAAVSIPSGIRIKEVLVSEGDSVKKGTRLASVYPASVAEVLLEVRDSIDTVEDALDDLDEDEISDTTSEDYLKKLTYDQELSDLEELEEQLQDMLETGYIKAESAGIVGTINVSEETEAGSSSTTTGDVSSTDVTAAGYGAGNMTSGIRTVSSLLLSTVATITGDGTDDSESSTEKEESTEAASATAQTAEENTQTSSDSSKETTETGSSAAREETKDTATSSGTGTTAGSGSSTGTESTSGTGSAQAASTQTTQSVGTAGTSETTGSTAATATGKQTAPGKQAGAGAGTAAASGQSSGTTETAAESGSIADIEMVNAFILNSGTQMLVTVSIDEADIGSVQEGQTAEVTLTALSGETFEGTISSVSNVSTSSGSSVKYEVEITIEKTDEMLSGMSASATIYIDKAENVIVIPSAAIREKGGKAFVYTRKDSDGTLSGETEVTTGLSDGSQVEITEGLSEGDTVYYEISSSGKSGDSSGYSEKRGDFGGSMPGSEGGGPGGMPGNPPSGSQGGGN